MPIGPKMVLPMVSRVYIGLYIYREKHEKIFLSETIRPRALIFGMLHHLVDLNQVGSNYITWASKGPALGVAYLGLYWENMKISSCLKP